MAPAKQVQGKQISAGQSSGQPFATQPVLEARGANGNIDVETSGSATIAVQSGSVSLSGTTAQSWSHGRAIFTALAIASTSDGTAFTLQASASGLASGITSSLTCDVVASQLVFAQDASHAGVPHGDGLSGGAFQNQPIVQPADLRFETQPITRARRGQLYSYQPAVANADGDALSFYLLEGPQRMRVDSQTGPLS